MSLSTIDRSREDAAPVFLYVFTQGETVWRYAAMDGGFVSPAGAYAAAETAFEAAAITHSTLTSSGDLRRADVTLTFPLDHEFPARFLGNDALFQTVAVRILRADVRAPEAGTAVNWIGRVAGTKTAGERFELRCESAATRLPRSAGGVISPNCDHALYGPGCGLALADWQTAGTATARSGVTVTVAAAGAQANGWYAGGVLSFEGRLAQITQHAGAALTLRGLPYGLAAAIDGGAGDVLIAPGCDRLAETCDAKFGNALNWRGFAGIAGGSILSGRRFG